MDSKVSTLILCLGKLGGKVGENIQNQSQTNRTKIVAIDTDLNLLNRLSITTHQIAAKRREGAGCGEDEHLGEKSCNDDLNTIIEITEAYNKIIIIGGLGKGFTTGAAVALSEFFMRSQKIVVFVLTTPFSIEGQVPMNKANEALVRIRKNSKAIICLSNDLLFSKLPADSPVQEVFELATTYIYSGIQSLLNLLDEDLNDTISIEFSALSESLTHQKADCSIAHASSETNDFEELARSILDNPLSGGEAFVHAADRVLIKVSGGGLNINKFQEGIHLLSEKFKCLNQSRYGAQFQLDERPLTVSCLFISYPEKRTAAQNLQPEFNLIDHNSGIFTGRKSILFDDNSYSLDIPTYQRLNISLDDLD
ncbi:MAG: hypothetical protein KAG98_01340 [Lentisphaeria bacterium]|nr:hypothetical protein [Lentisphaeria bacterium]